jgi:hypothetical protein
MTRRTTGAEVGADSGTTINNHCEGYPMSEQAQPLGAAVNTAITRNESKKVIFASSLGTVFEWYDFFLYGALAAVISKQFFARPALWCARSVHWCLAAWAT